MTAVDDLAEVARGHGAWFHVDGAYGLIAAASQVLRPAFAAVADADSVIVDPHKWFATGVGCAATYVRDAGPLRGRSPKARPPTWRAPSPPTSKTRSSSLTASESPTWTWAWSCRRPAAACGLGGCGGTWAALVSRPEWNATSGSRGALPSGPVSTRAWNCCWTGNCQSPVSATQLTTRSTPKSSRGYAALPG